MEETRGPVEKNFTNAQIEAVKKIRSARDNYERLGLLPGSTRDQINKQYKKMAILLHPDKSLAPGAEEAFKLLTIARSQLLRYANWKSSLKQLGSVRSEINRFFIFHALQFNPINLNAFNFFIIFLSY